MDGPRVLSFGSVAEMVEYGDGPETGELGRQSRTLPFDFTGTYSWPEAKEIALAGYDDLRPMVDELVPAVLEGLDTATQTEMLPTWDVSGGAVDMGRFITGEPECMVDFQMQDVPAERAIKVLVNTTVHAGIDKQLIMKRGAVVVALIEALNRAKYSVELWTETATRNHKDEGVHSVRLKVKDAEEPFDINAFMFTVAHPSFLRRIVFAAWEREPVSVRRKWAFTRHGGYSAPTDLTFKELGAHVEIEKLNGYGDQIVTEPLAWLRGQIQRIQTEGVIQAS